MKNSYFTFAGATLAAATALNMAGVANASVAGMQGLYAKIICWLRTVMLQLVLALLPVTRITASWMSM